MQIKKPRVKLGAIFWSAFFFALGGSLAVTIGLSPLINIDWALPIGDVLGSFLNIIFAVIVAWIIERRSADNRVEKELIIKRIDEITERLRSLKELTESGIYDYRLAASRIK